jgi:hypothetical protein
MPTFNHKKEKHNQKQNEIRMSAPRQPSTFNLKKEKHNHKQTECSAPPTILHSYNPTILIASSSPASRRAIAPLP